MERAWGCQTNRSTGEAHGDAEFASDTPGRSRHQGCNTPGTREVNWIIPSLDITFAKRERAKPQHLDDFRTWMIPCWLGGPTMEKKKTCWTLLDSIHLSWLKKKHYLGPGNRTLRMWKSTEHQNLSIFHRINPPWVTHLLDLWVPRTTLKRHRVWSPTRSGPNCWSKNGPMKQQVWAYEEKHRESVRFSRNLRT